MEAGAHAPAGNDPWWLLVGAPAIALALVLCWLLPLHVWSLVLLGAVSTVIFALVWFSYRGLQARLRLAKPALVAAGVMYTLALFTLAYASLALAQKGSVQTDGNSLPHHLGVAALLASAMGIAGGEVGAHVQGGARIVAHVQLLLVLGAVAGVGGQVVKRLAGEDGGAADVVTRPRSLTLELYARVYARLSERGGEAALDEVDEQDPGRRAQLLDRIRQLPSPETATEWEAATVFERIRTGDLEAFYTLPFEGSVLGRTVAAWLRRNE